ncbi:MAG: methyltransferase domain-containing protein [Planctomycetaceae bacterium]|nr:methyltransferase domain-containing protein [Planctomycetaceae bacterium]
MEYFMQIYGTLPRAGPGSNELTRRAYQLLTDIPESPRILDVGCGPGMQTVELLKISNGSVVALDLLPQMIERVQAEAERAGVSDRLVTIEQDMSKMDFPPGSFDVIWSEGAIYLMGFEAGLKKLKQFVKPGGYVAVSEVVWLKPNPPSELVQFWQEYPEIDTVEAKLGVIERSGYELIDHFLFPPSAWMEHYYDPMEKRIAEKALEWRGNSEGEAVLKEAKHEISMFQQYSDYYSYAFFVMRNPVSA